MSAYPDDRLTGVWLRVDSGIGRDPRVAQLAKGLNVPVATAIGHLVQFWGGLAEHAPNGSLLGVLPVTLEDWAGWRGRRGRFEAAFRPLFVTENGEVRKWHEHNGYHLSRAAADAARKRSGRAADRDRDTLRNVRTMSSVPNETQPNPTTPPPPVGAGEEGRKAGAVLDVPAIARITEALNDGMRANPAIGHFRPVKVAPIAGEWLDAGISLNLIIETVARLGREFKPNGKDHQISSLKYCDTAVREAPLAADEARYQFLAGEARRGMDMADPKYHDWPKYRARYHGREAVSSGSV